MNEQNIILVAGAGGFIGGHLVVSIIEKKQKLHLH